MLLLMIDDRDSHEKPPTWKIETAKWYRDPLLLTCLMIGVAWAFAIGYLILEIG